MGFYISMEGVSNRISPSFRKVKDTQLKSVQQSVPVSNAKTENELLLEKKRKKRKGILVGTGVAAIGGVALSVLYRRNIVNFTEDFIRKMYTKIAQLRQNKGKDLSIKDKLGVRLAHFLDKTIMSSQIIVNFSAMKDSVLKKATYSTVLAKLGEKLTAIWESLAVKAVKSDYSKCNKSFVKMHSEVEKTLQQVRAKGDLSRIVFIDGHNYSVEEVLKLIEIRLKSAKQTYNTKFSHQAFDRRNQMLKGSLKDVNDRFFEAYTSADYYREFGFTRFTVEEWLTPIKNSYQGYILKSKMSISNNIEDKFVATQVLLKNVDKIIPPRDAKSRLILNDVMKKLEQYKKLSGVTEKEARAVLTKNIEESLKLLLEEIEKSPFYSKDSIKNISVLINDAKVAVNMGQKGDLQEVLTYLKAILPKEEYIKIRSQIDKTSKKLNTVTGAEGDLYFDKLRDIVLGSALSDVAFGMLTPLATMGAVLAMEDTEEERLSTVLRLGIPLVGGIATSTAFLFLLASGGKAMLMSSIASAGLNRVGTFVDNRITKRRQEDEWQKSAQYDSLINNVNTSTTLLTTGPVGVAMDKVANKGVDVLTTAAGSTADKVIQMASRLKTNEAQANSENQ